MCGVGAYVDAQRLAAVEQAKAQPGQSRWQAGRERQCLAMVAHAAKTSDRGKPGAGQSGQVQAIARVGREIAQVGEGRLTEVVIGELGVADLGGHDRLDSGR